MKTKELKREEWPGFCQKLGKERAGAIVTVQKTQESGTERPIVASGPLEGVNFAARTGECSDVLTIRAGGVEHTVIEPIYVRLKNGGSDRYNQIEILAESGGTIIQLSPGLPENFIVTAE